MTANPSTAPAAMPGEDDIARAIYHGKPRNKPWGVLTHEFKNQYRKQARHVLGVFAPILEEKERLRAYALDAEERCSDLIDAANADWSKHGATEIALGQWKARALAAEAALAAERERCIAIVDAQVPDWVKERSGPYWEGYRDAMEDAAEDMRKGSTRRAAAIRAQGE